MKASVVIRTKNEEKWLPEVLSRLGRQKEKSFEVILVDDSSEDDTVKIFKNSKIKDKKLIKLEPGKFNYPYAANVGVRAAKGSYIFFLSGHSVPKSDEFISSGVRHLSKKHVAGVHGWCAALPDASLTEKAFYYFERFDRKPRTIKKVVGGVLGLTNAGIKKELWKEHNFNEKDFAEGAEDMEWALYFHKRGYKIVYEPKMGVYHSHGKGFFKFFKQWIHWRVIAGRALRYKE
jgi:glycosyltransferase involved in cell wall biosynthesis